MVPFGSENGLVRCDSNSAVYRVERCKSVVVGEDGRREYGLFVYLRPNGYLFDEIGEGAPDVNLVFAGVSVVSQDEEFGIGGDRGVDVVALLEGVVGWFLELIFLFHQRH